jgi:hypothetical protein
MLIIVLKANGSIEQGPGIRGREAGNRGGAKRSSKLATYEPEPGSRNIDMPPNLAIILLTNPESRK